MMKKWLGFLLIITMVFALAACGTKDNKSDENKDKETETDTKTLVVGASNVPHAEILEQVKPILADQGIDLKIEKFQDYVVPNQALDSKDLDANYFQHIPYLETQIADNDYDFEIAGEIHIEPIGVYSKKFKDLDKLPKGALVIISSSVSDHGRILTILEKEGLIKLKEGVKKVSATVDDIVENKKELVFKTEYAPELLPQIFNNNEGDAVLINSNYAIDAGLDPLKDSIALEKTDSPYVNVVAVRKGDKDKPEIKALVEALLSTEIQDWILEKYNNAVVPVTK